MAGILESDIGKVHLLGKNPRKIRDNSFQRLVESIERDEDFLRTRGVVVWKVPEDLSVAEGAKSPFVGQEGKIVVIGGNMRCNALKALGKKRLKREWMVEAKGADGNWWSPEAAERFVLVDNGNEGLAGENDYERMAEFFNESTMRIAGIDFSEFQALQDEGKVEPMEMVGEDGKTPEEELEEGESGEKSEELQAFIAEREKTRAQIKFIDETGFHLLAIFDDMEEKAKFVAESGLCGRGGRVAGNGTNYVDLVFETSVQKEEFAKEAGLLSEDDEGDPRLMYGMYCDGRYIAEKMGIELKPSMMKFRDRKIDTRLSAMAMEEKPQKTPDEIAEEQYARLKAERRELGMSTRSSGRRGEAAGVGEDDVEASGGRRKEKKYTDAEDIGRGPGIYVREEEDDVENPEVDK